MIRKILDLLTVVRELQEKIAKKADKNIDNTSVNTNTKSVPEEIAWLGNEAGLNLDDALEYTGSPHHLLKFVKTFYESLDHKADVIENALDIGDLDLYAIKVHALKSAARVMGARSLASLAKDLEYAAKDGDTDTVNSQTDALLDLYRSFKDKLVKIEDVTIEPEPAPSKLSISDTELSNAFDALKKFVKEMDYDAIEMILAELSQYDLPSDASDKVAAFSDALKDYNWAAMAESIK